MSEYFVRTMSFAAPFVSEPGDEFVEAEAPEAALEAVASRYSFPAGLYSAECYRDANAYHKGEKPLATWLCNHEQAKQRLTADQPSYSYLGHGPGDFEINGTRHTILNPKGGSVVAHAP